MSGAHARRLRIGIGLALAVLLAAPLGVAASVLAPDDPSVLPLDAPPNTTSWIVTMKPGVDTTHSSTFSKAAGGRAGQVYKHALKGFLSLIHI